MRTSPVHYIAPSSISIVPNANGSQRDLAVYIARGTKIKVHCPRAGIGTPDGDFQEWTLTGRNRRLNDDDGSREYTIYARLSMSDHNTGYIVFAPKTGDGSDKYQYLTLDDAAINGVTVIAGAISSSSDWYIRLGDVSAVVNGQRTVTLDTGILGTDDYNNNWAQNPDDLPLRIELVCTVDGADAGQMPYVYWNQQLVLTATLTEGWTGTDIQRFDHWEIIRDSGESGPDEAWNRPAGEGSYHTMQDGQIALRHVRGLGDDFNGAVAVTFTVMAMERNPEYSDGLEVDKYLVLKSATINVHSETAEKYSIDLSDSIVTYDPQANTYNPASGVTVTFRVTNQRGDMSELTKEQFDNAHLALQYAPSGSDTWTPLSLSNTSALATAVIPIAAFSAQRSLNLRLVETGSSSATSESISSSEDESSESPALVRLSVASIAFVRDGRTVPGAQGKMCYIVGEYRDDVEYRSDETSTVAVEVAGSGNTTELYILKAETNVVGGVHYPPKDAGGNVSTEYWERGLNQYNLIRTKYLFADFAHLGSFIVSGDWQFSQYGTLKWYADGAAQTTEINGNNHNSASFGGKVPYLWFSDSDPAGTATPTDDTGTWRFIPTWAVDGKTGKTYQQDVYIRGEVHATSGEFEGIVKANLLYQATYGITNNSASNPYYINPQNEPYSTFIASVGLTDIGAFAVLPEASLYDGLELKFFHFPLITLSGNPGIFLKADSFTRDDGSTYLKSINCLIETEHGPMYDSPSYVQIGEGMAVLKSIRGEWWVVQGSVIPLQVW